MRNAVAGLCLASVMLCGCAVQSMDVQPVHVADRPSPPGIAEVDSQKNPTGVTAPVLIYSRDPKYPPGARLKRQSCTGGVTLDIIVTKEGTVRDISVVNSCKGFDESAINAVKTYRFKPSMKDGVPVAVHVTMQVSFNIY